MAESYFMLSVECLASAAKTLLKLLPFVVGGVLLGEYIKSAAWVKHLTSGAIRSGRMSIVPAGILGIISPLCTYGTIPILMQLYKRGVPVGPLMAFLSTSSLMNPQLFVLTWGGIGPEMAMMRLFVVMVFGTLVGFFLQSMSTKSILKQEMKDGDILPRIIHDEQGSKKRYGKYGGFFKQLHFVGFYVIIGVLAGAVVEVFVPGRLIFDWLRPGSWFSVPLAAMLGVPLYACGGAVIPFIRSLLLKGMSQGAALAFFIVGPATRIAPLSAMLTIVRPVFLLGYVITLICYSLIAGMLYQ